MADAPVVVTDADETTPAVGQLFKDISFFLSLRLPTRSKFVADVEANGGRVVKLEKYADFVIADHMRKPTPVGSFSYTLIEQAIRDGTFPNPADHALGSAADSPRAAGSRVPGKRTRTPFTAEDVRALWQWVENAKEEGQSVKGQEIYKRLEAVNPRHTWQAWRDHYVKKLIDHPPFGAAVAVDASPSQASARDSEEAETPAHEEPDQADMDLLWDQAEDIENMDETMYEEAWDMWAQVNEQQTAARWRQIWEIDVRPAYRKERAKAKAKRRYASMSDGNAGSPAVTTPRKKGKKRKMATAEINAGTNGNGNKQPAIGAGVDGPDDDLAALETWQESSSRRKPVPKHRRLEGSDLPTSDVDRAVNQQFQAEINGTALKAYANDQVITSDVNRAADLQIQNEANGKLSKQHTPVEVSSEQSIASGADRDVETRLREESSDGVPAHIPSGGHDENDQGEFTTEEDLRAWYAERVAELEGIANTTTPSSNIEAPVDPGHALTEANLVSQQAEHAEPLTRGVDLPKDDQNKDQSEYVKFLQNVTGQPRNEDEDADFEDDLPSAPRRVQSLNAAPGAREVSNIPISSEQEVDNVMEDAFEWPSSPQNKQKQAQAQEQAQLRHARLPLSKDHIRSLVPDFELSSQSLMSQTNGENDLSQGEWDATYFLADVYQQPDAAQRVFRSEAYHSDIFIGLDDIDNTHIQLNIPEPEGEFTFTSSPERELPAAGTKVRFDQAPDVKNSEFVERNVQNTGPSHNVVVDISSDDSSSSLQSSQESQALPKPAKAVQDQRKHAVETQDIISAETQAPDFFMPVPDDEQEQENEVVPNSSVRHAKETQDIVSAETQAPDLSMPLPPDWELQTGSRAAGKRPAKQQKQKQKVVESQTMDVEKELENWLNTQHVRGFSEASAIRAMQRSSMRPDLAELILLAERGGLGLPKDVPGIWSEREDQVLESGDSGGLRRLEAKHGWEEWNARMRFLAEWREA